MGAVTSEQQALIDVITPALERDARVQAAWLAGSLGRGAGDAYSDVDFLALTELGTAREVSTDLAADVGRIAAAVLVNSLYGGRVLNVVTEDWRRFDVAFVEATDLVRYDGAQLSPLFNRVDMAPPPRPRVVYRATPMSVQPKVTEFLRILGLTPGAMGREEYVLGLSGLELLRRLTMDLMLEENGVGPAELGGALRRNPLLTADQRAELEGLPPAAANRQSVIDGSAALAAIFLPRARRLAAAIGMSWPSAFEAATRRHLLATLGLEI